MNHGIPNLGNTCFFNACTQALAASSHLILRLNKYAQPGTFDMTMKRLFETNGSSEVIREIFSVIHTHLGSAGSAAEVCGKMLELLSPKIREGIEAEVEEENVCTKCGEKTSYSRKQLITIVPPINGKYEPNTFLTNIGLQKTNPEGYKCKNDLAVANHKTIITFLPNTFICESTPVDHINIRSILSMPERFTIPNSTYVYEKVSEVLYVPGHYFALCKSPSAGGGWNIYNDSSVMPSKDLIRRGNAIPTMVVFQRVF